MSDLDNPNDLPFPWKVIYLDGDRFIVDANGKHVLFEPSFEGFVYLLNREVAKIKNGD